MEVAEANVCWPCHSKCKIWGYVGCFYVSVLSHKLTLNASQSKTKVSTREIEFNSNVKVGRERLWRLWMNLWMNLNLAHINIFYIADIFLPCLQEYTI